MADVVEIEDVTVKRETTAAILCEIGDEDVWIPKSQVDDSSEVWSMKNRGPGKLVIPLWFAEKSGLA